MKLVDLTITGYVAINVVVVETLIVHTVANAENVELILR